MRVAVIGPISPFRGGIAHSNETMCRNLAKNHIVKVFSFKRLFPKALYPGQFQKEDKSPPKDLDIDFCIDSVNPLNWSKTAGKINRFNPDVVIFLWWTTFLTPCYSFLAKMITAKKTVLCHNLFPHESSWLNTFLTKFFLKYSYNMVVLSKQELEEAKKMGFNPTLLVEPIYDVAGQPISKEQAKKELGITKRFLLFFGFVRPYKGLEYLLDAMKEVRKDVDLWVVGEFWGKKSYDLGRVNVIDRYVSDAEIKQFFCACDTLVLPYVSSTQSGIIQIAFAYGTPIITTNVGGNPDLIENDVNGLLVEPKNATALAKAINYFYANNCEEKFRAKMKEKDLSWNEEKEKILLGEIL